MKKKILIRALISIRRKKLKALWSVLRMISSRCTAANCILFPMLETNRPSGKRNVSLDESQYEEYIVIDSAFRSPIFGGGGWSAARIYTWNWILGRNAGGEWVVIDKGYC